MGASNGAAAAAGERRPRRILLRLLLAIALSVAVLAGLVWWHFETTPNFAEWVDARPVADEVWMSRTTAEGTPLAELGFLGSVDPTAEHGEDLETGKWAEFRFDVDHGDDVLLRSNLAARAALDAETYNLRGLAFEARELAHDPRFRVVAVISVQGPADETWSTARANVTVVVDSFLIAGPGEARIVVRHGESVDLKQLPVFEKTGLSGLAGSLLLQPFGAPPEEGLWYHARQRMSLSWQRRGSAGSGAGIHGHLLATSNEEYSLRVFGETADVSAEGGSHRSSLEQSRTISWGSTW